MKLKVLLEAVMVNSPRGMKDFYILKNPTLREIIKLRTEIKKEEREDRALNKGLLLTETKIIRYSFLENNLYVWNAYKFTHASLKNYLFRTRDLDDFSIKAVNGYINSTLKYNIDALSEATEKDTKSLDNYFRKLNIKKIYD